jgi:16S rRNA (guanine966-N2)-methyltransferase
VSELRVIGGKARGRKLRTVPGDTTRPITDKVKEALFNIIGGDIEGAAFLDLFAGTGSVGIEALSRGAQHVLFIELNRRPAEVVRENLKSTALEKDAVVIQGDAFKILGKTASYRYDYIYIAPPQYKDMWSKALAILDKQVDWLTEDGWVIVQIHPIEYKPVAEGFELMNLEEFDQRHYGSTLLVFYHKKLENN